MLQFETKYFGLIEYDPERIIYFDEGLPGFPGSKRFLFMSETPDEKVFFWLQSLDEFDVAFTLMDLYTVIPDYSPVVEEEEMIGLCDSDDDVLDIYNIVVIPEDVRQMRTNLRAPIVINMKKGVGKQVVCADDSYPIRHMLFDQAESAGLFIKEDNE